MRTSSYAFVLSLGLLLLAAIPTDSRKSKKSKKNGKDKAPYVPNFQGTVTMAPDDYDKFPLKSCSVEHRIKDFDNDRGNVAWFWLGPTVISVNDTFFDMTTALSKDVRTQFTLYNGTGGIVARANSSHPFLSFGDTNPSRPKIGKAGPFRGQNGRLGAGQFHVACTVYNQRTTFDRGYVVLNAPKSDESCKFSFRYCTKEVDDRRD